MAEKQVTEDGQSYQKYNILLFRDLSSRAGNVNSKDEQLINVIPEIIQDKNSGDARQFLLKRAGTQQLIASVADKEVRGMVFWDDFNKLIYCVDNDIYVYDFNTDTSTTLSNVFVTTTGNVGFTEYLYDTGVNVMIATDGNKLLQISSTNVVTTCTDPDLPSPHLPYPVFIDGYLFLVKANTADIYNSNLNDPMQWTSGNFISAEMSPDLLVRIAKINNYLIAFGTTSIEYFWDAGNPSGSPLQRNDSPVKINTYLAGYSQFGNTVMYIGKNTGGQPSVYTLKDFQVEDVGTPTISRYLNYVTEDQTTWRSGLLAAVGHTSYVLSAGTVTYVYDIESKLWTTWAYQNDSVFPIVFSVRVTNNTEKFSIFAFKGNNSAIYVMRDDLAQDNGVNYTCKIITEQSNFGSLNRKTMARLSIMGDRTPYDSDINVSWTDDDYQSWSTPRAINLNQDLSSTWRLGSFRQRAFKLEYSGPYIFRIQTLEVDVNKGIS